MHCAESCSSHSHNRLTFWKLQVSSSASRKWLVLWWWQGINRDAGVGMGGEMDGRLDLLFSPLSRACMENIFTGKSFTQSCIYTPILSSSIHTWKHGPSKFPPWQHDVTDLCILAWEKVRGTHWGLYESRCPPLCTTPLYPPPHPPQPLNLLPVPQLAYKAHNELFIAAIHLHTSHCNCFPLWFALWLCICRQTAKKT